MIRRLLLVLFLFNMVIFSAHGAKPKAENSEPKDIIVDFKPFVVAYSEEGKVIYTLDYTIRLVINSNFKETLEYDYPKIRDTLLIMIKKYVNRRPDYKTIKYDELKGYIAQYLIKNYTADNIKNVLISTAFIK